MNQRDEVCEVLDALSEEIPPKRDFAFTYQEVSDFLRNQDLPPKEVERLLRLLRRKCVAFMRVSDALERWSVLNV
jgi:hypothetical protein